MCFGQFAYSGNVAKKHVLISMKVVQPFKTQKSYFKRSKIVFLHLKKHVEKSSDH